jgi:hypothetical protein
MQFRDFFRDGRARFSVRDRRLFRLDFQHDDAGQMSELSPAKSEVVDLALGRFWRGRIGPAKFFDEELSEFEILKQLAVRERLRDII